MLVGARWKGAEAYRAAPVDLQQRLLCSCYPALTSTRGLPLSFRRLLHQLRRQRQVLQGMPQLGGRGHRRLRQERPLRALVGMADAAAAHPLLQRPSVLCHGNCHGRPAHYCTSAAARFLGTCGGSSCHQRPTRCRPPACPGSPDANCEVCHNGSGKCQTCFRDMAVSKATGKCTDCADKNCITCDSSLKKCSSCYRWGSLVELLPSMAGMNACTAACTLRCTMIYARHVPLRDCLPDLPLGDTARVHALRLVLCLPAALTLKSIMFGSPCPPWPAAAMPLTLPAPACGAPRPTATFAHPPPSVSCPLQCRHQWHPSEPALEETPPCCFNRS